MDMKQVIDSLRYCSASGGSCRECPSYRQDSGCLDKLHAEAAALLEAQQKRITELEALDEQPTVDAVEVVHGRWEDVQETEMYVPDMKFTITKTAETCSECKARIGFVGAKQYLFDAVCPSCGAKMDGDGNG